MPQSLQDQFFQQGICFGCGPANPDGLQIKSYVTDDGIICDWQAKSRHQAFPGVINGGIIGALIDCHANWSAAYYLMQANELEQPPCTVTAEYGVKLKKPTPFGAKIHLHAVLESISEQKATIKVELFADGVLTATGHGTFVAVKPDHPAYHRW